VPQGSLSRAEEVAVCIVNPTLMLDKDKGAEKNKRREDDKRK
jgi:hypothetical protein